MNCLQLIGNVGQDPEVRYFENGTMLVELSIAVKRFKKEEPPVWFRLKIWGKQAQITADYVKKGSLLGVIGRVDEETWADRQTGEKRSRYVVIVNHVELLGSKSNSQSSEEVPF